MGGVGEHPHWGLGASPHDGVQGCPLAGCRGSAPAGLRAKPALVTYIWLSSKTTQKLKPANSEVSTHQHKAT